MDKKSLTSLFPDHSTTDRDGHLIIGGCSVADLAQKYGTPLYIFDETTIQNRCQNYLKTVRQHYPQLSQVSYAGKAGLNIAIANLIKDEGLGLDVVSGGELYVSQQASFPPERIHFHGNNKTLEEIEYAVRIGVSCIVVDNFYELEQLIRISNHQQKRIKIWLRLSPGVDAHTHEYRKTGLVDSKFGFPMSTNDAELAVKKSLDANYLDLAGLHNHIGSQISDIGPFLIAIKKTIEFAKIMNTKYGFRLSEFSPGGGWGVPEPDQLEPASVSTYVDSICRQVVDTCHAFDLPAPKLTLEPGRSIIAQAGVAVYTIGSRKEIHGVRTYISVDGGMADNIRPALYGAVYAAYPVTHKTNSPIETVTIAGKYCESGDILIRDVNLPFMKPGDLLAVPMVGAYALAMSSNYNMSCRPAVVHIKNKIPIMVQRRETYEDLIARDVIDNQ